MIAQGAIPRIPAERLTLFKRSTTFALLLGAEFLYGWSWSTVDVLRPQLRASVEVSLSQVGALYSVQAFGALIGAIVFGQLGDRLGRRNVLSAILAAFGLCLITGAYINDYGLLIAQRLALGVFLGGVQPLVSSIYLGLFPLHVRGKLASGVNGVFTLSVVGLGMALGWLQSDSDWRQLLWAGGLAAIVLSPLLQLFAVDDRGVLSIGHAAEEVGPAATVSPLRALFGMELRRLTIIIAVMAGCNYFATQAFQGWTSTYLSADRAIDTTAVGRILAWQAAGSLIGGFFWGWFGDRFGRRSASIGYIVGLTLIIYYVLLAQGDTSFRVAGFLIGTGLAASVIWAPWVAELFPDQLRATALSIFNWGRIVSLFAPLTTGAVAERYSLSIAMLLAVPALVTVVLLWRRLPETIRVN